MHCNCKNVQRCAKCDA